MDLNFLSKKIKYIKLLKTSNLHNLSITIQTLNMAQFHVIQESLQLLMFIDIFNVCIFVLD